MDGIHSTGAYDYSAWIGWSWRRAGVILIFADTQVTEHQVILLEPLQFLTT